MWVFCLHECPCRGQLYVVTEQGKDCLQLRLTTNKFCAFVLILHLCHPYFWSNNLHPVSFTEEWWTHQLSIEKINKHQVSIFLISKILMLHTPELSVQTSQACRCLLNLWFKDYTFRDHFDKFVTKQTWFNPKSSSHPDESVLCKTQLQPVMLYTRLHPIKRF